MAGTIRIGRCSQHNGSCADDVGDKIRKHRAELSPKVKAPSSLPGAFELPERLTRHARSRRRL
jgi:hypothetical protein